MVVVAMSARAMCMSNCGRVHSAGKTVVKIAREPCCQSGKGGAVKVDCGGVSVSVCVLIYSGGARSNSERSEDNGEASFERSMCSTKEGSVMRIFRLCTWTPHNLKHYPLIFPFSQPPRTKQTPSRLTTFTRGPFTKSHHRLPRLPLCAPLRHSQSN